MSPASINPSWLSVGRIILATIGLCLGWVVIGYLKKSNRGQMDTVRTAPSWLTGLGAGLKKFLSPGWIVSLIVVIAVWRLVDVKLHAPPRPDAPVTAKTAVFRPALKPVYVCQRPEHFQIIAPPGDPKDPKAWYQAEQLVMPDHCELKIITPGKVWWRDQFGYIHQDGPENQHAGYGRNNNRHVWFISREEKPVVVDVRFTPSRFH